MSDYMGDLASVFGTVGAGRTDAANSPPVAKKDKGTLDLNDYLKLMVAMFQNQTIDNTADISDMMNNMVQMSVVEAVASISSLIEESTALNYAASLVGKQVTVGIVNNGQMIEIEGYVAATGTYNGQQVVFLKDKSGNPIEGYVPITSIMAIGWLSETGAADVVGDPEEPGDAGGSDGIEGSGGTEGSGGLEGSGEGEGSGGVEEPDEIETPEETGGNQETDGFGGPLEAGGAGGTGETGGTGEAGEIEETSGISAVSGADGYGEPMR